MTTFDLFQLSDVPLNVGELAASLCSTHAGAFVSFEGRVRDTNEDLLVVRCLDLHVVGDGQTVLGAEKHRCPHLMDPFRLELAR